MWPGQAPSALSGPSSSCATSLVCLTCSHLSAPLSGRLPWEYAKVLTQSPFFGSPWNDHSLRMKGRRSLQNVGDGSVLPEGLRQMPLLPFSPFVSVVRERRAIRALSPSLSHPLVPTSSLDEPSGGGPACSPQSQSPGNLVFVGADTRPSGVSRVIKWKNPWLNSPFGQTGTFVDRRPYDEAFQSLFDLQSHPD